MPPLSRLFLVLLLFPAVSFAEILGDLSADERARVLEGAQVVKMEEIAGLPWPRIRIYQKVRATPEQVAAVFFDYKNAKDYVPKLLKSEISKTISPCVLEVDYVVDVPILPDELYTARNTMSQNNDSYRVEWILLRALQTKASEGNLRMEPLGDGTVICYTNLVTPGSRMAGILRIPAIEQMKSTVAAIVRQVESQKTKSPLALEAQVLALRAALKADGKPANP